MSDLRNSSIKVCNFKCFEDWQGFDTILPINLIVGRNNSGKSSLLDMLRVDLSKDPDTARSSKPAEWRFGKKITPDQIEAIVREAQRCVQGLRVDQARYYAKQCVGLEVTNDSPIPLPQLPRLDRPQKLVFRGGEQVKDATTVAIATGLQQAIGHPLAGLHYVRLCADRDIIPAPPNDDADVGKNGQTATALIERYLHKSGRPDDLVQSQLRSDLNRIIEPDWSFTRIEAKRIDENDKKNWELNLRHKNGPLVPLSHTGSGVKTLLLVLANIHLVPHAREKKLSDFVFCFEELENNLHPAVQRRLFSFLRDKAVKDHCTFFITTHSNVVIDMFSRDEQVQLLHVRHDGTKAEVKPVSSHIHQCGVLLDLDVKASDLLQANAIVWVEGTSDAIYFKKWIELWSNDELREGSHFQCVWYGGSMLTNVSFDDPGEGLELKAMMEALRVNRNAIVLMDSDKRDDKAPLKKSVEKVCGAPKDNGGFAWVTEGREVENYTPVEVLHHIRGKPTSEGPGKYQSIFKFLGYKAPASYPKVDAADRVTRNLKREMLEKVYDLPEKLTKVCEKLREWNGLK